jgi:hypothetical protein
MNNSILSVQIHNAKWEAEFWQKKFAYIRSPVKLVEIVDKYTQTETNSTESETQTHTTVTVNSYTQIHMESIVHTTFQ